MDKFVYKLGKTTDNNNRKKSSHLPVNISVKDRVNKYPPGTFYEDDGLMFCSFCNIVIDHSFDLEIIILTRNAHKIRFIDNSYRILS